MVSMFNSVQVDGILVQEAFVDVNETWVRRRGKRVDILYSQRLKESNARLLESKGGTRLSEREKATLRADESTSKIS